MKLLKTLTAFLTLVLLQIAVSQWLEVPPPAEARMLMVKGAVTEEGPAPASGNYRPDADISIGSWCNEDFGSTNLYAEIDDNVTTGNAGDTRDVICWEQTTIYEIGMQEITGSVSSLRIHTRAQVSHPHTKLIGVFISRDGSTWIGPQAIVPGYSDTYAWNSYTFSGLSWAGTTDFRIRLQTDGDFVLKIDVLYAEANPS